MIINVEELKQRDSAFWVELFESIPPRNYAEIKAVDEDYLDIRININGVDVPLTVLEQMYNRHDEVVMNRARRLLTSIMSEYKRKLDIKTDDYKKDIDILIKELSVEESE